MSHSFPYPDSLPLKRLSVEDGLLLNAEMWQLAHAYHNQRQNLHYQSLNQPGIVCGLGVSAIPAPEEIPAKYRDGKWIKIAAGIAIDLLGNLIIIPQAIEFRVASEAREKPLLVYITISYVDPEKLYRSESKQIIEETFRIDEKTNSPGKLEIEVCRILLAPKNSQISAPTNVFYPEENNLDLRYRQQVKARPQGTVRVGLVTEDPLILSDLFGLIQSLPALYPALSVDAVEQINFQTEEHQQIFNYDLLYFSYEQLTYLTELEVDIFREYILQGGVIMVELITSQIQLDRATVTLDRDLSSVISTVKKFAETVDDSASFATGLIDRQNPLRNQPFLFSKFPTIAQQDIKIFNWGGVILVLGNLAVAWGLSKEIDLSRETIRSAQEMGINILHFAWKKRQLSQLYMTNL